MIEKKVDAHVFYSLKSLSYFGNNIVFYTHDRNRFTCVLPFRSRTARESISNNCSTLLGDSLSEFGVLWFNLGLLWAPNQINVVSGSVHDSRSRLLPVEQMCQRAGNGFRSCSVVMASRLR